MTIEASDNSGYKLEIKEGIASLISQDQEMLCEFMLDEQEEGWIPCSERLPELHRVEMETEGEYYMISNPVLVTDGNKMYVAEYEEDDGYRYGWSGYDGECYEGIIAWQPLPEPYKG